MSETLILVPGVGNTRQLFEAQIAALGSRRNIIVADHAQDDSIPGIAARLLREAPERFALAGLSMGGYVAMEVARQAPWRVQRLALLDTSARPDTAETRQDRERLIDLVNAGRLDEAIFQLWPRLVAPEHHGDGALREIVAGMAREVGAESFIRQQRAVMARSDSRPRLSDIAVPTLVLVGEADAITPPALAREIAEGIEWSSLTVVPGAGHLSTLERPELVTQALKLWLDGR